VGVLRATVLILFSAAGLAGCSGLLPRAEFATQQTWTNYDNAKAAIDRIVPMQSRRADLAADGIDPHTNAALTILSYSEVVQRFALGSAIGQEELDPGIRRCLTAGKACTGYSIVVRRTSRKRIGNFWLDSFNFYRETDVTGWSFNALVLFVDDLVVYTLHGGQPRVHDKEVMKNPLGPLQGWGQQVGPQIFD
jgi:hypothetical protein